MSELRRLNRAAAGRRATPEVLSEVGRVARELTARIEGHGPRDKAEDMASVLGWTPGTSQPLDLEVGQALEFDPFSVGGGRLHPSSNGMDLRRDGEESVVATVTVDPMFQGPPERVHGGFQALLVDEVMGAVNRLAGRRAFTARLTVHFRGAAPVATELTIRAWLEEVDGRKITIRAEGHSAQGRFLEADGLFIAWPEDDGA